jgi:hypothetical protein
LIFFLALIFVVFCTWSSIWFFSCIDFCSILYLVFNLIFFLALIFVVFCTWSSIWFFFLHWFL